MGSTPRAWTRTAAAAELREKLIIDQQSCGDWGVGGDQRRRHTTHTRTHTHTLGSSLAQVGAQPGIRVQSSTLVMPQLSASSPPPALVTGVVSPLPPARLGGRGGRESERRVPLSGQGQSLIGASVAWARDTPQSTAVPKRCLLCMSSCPAWMGLSQGSISSCACLLPPWGVN